MAPKEDHVRLFIPGPTEVPREVREQLARPMIGHRSSEFQQLYASVIPKLKKILYTDQYVFLSTSSATGIMEAAARNCVAKKVLCCMCGAFSDRWESIFGLNGKQTDRIQVEWGRAVHPEWIDEKLATGQFDAVAFTHNETSTGVMNPLEEAAEVVRKYPDVMLLVDAVSSMAGVKIEFDKLGIDVLLASVQKAYSCPPGLTVFAVSEKAMERSRTIKDRGYYFSFPEFLKYHEKNQTPTTPAIPHIYALDLQAGRILEEGLDNCWARHKAMQGACHKWVRDAGFELFAESGYESITLTTVKNTRGIDVNGLNNYLRENKMVLSNGYGKFKNETFRISHMGSCNMQWLEELFEAIDAFIKQTG